MREIKFRAWDKLAKAMRQNAHHVLGLCLANPDDFEVMQFTGLRDKNGKKIWEGDVLIWVGADGQKIDGPAVVEYWVGDACWMEVPTLNGLDSIHCEHYQVIGNIHENPELLKLLKP